MAGHKFNPKHALHLDNPLRKLFLSPEKVIGELAPASNDTWVDIGAGTGAFTIPLSRRVNKVFAVDISPEMLEHLKKKIEGEQTNNVEVLLSGETAIPLNDSCADGVLMGLVAHELDSPEQYFHELVRIMKPDGRLIVVEFAKVRSFGPPMKHRLDPETVDKWASEAGFAQGKTWKWSRAILGWEYLANKPAAA